MPQSLVQNYIHFVTSTKHREPLIIPQIEVPLHSYMVGIVQNMDCPVLQIGGVEDHVHLLFMLSTKVPLMEVVKQMKQSSSKWIKTQGEEYQNFQWQIGYGAFSVSQKSVEQVITYIQNQKEHHKRATFQDEYRKFLNTYEIPYDERYVWD
jgi:putative transposase